MPVCSLLPKPWPSRRAATSPAGAVVSPQGSAPRPRRPGLPDADGDGRLYHYTCTCHGLRGISETGLVLPHYQPLLVATLTWLVTLPQAHPFELGLTNQTVRCDRAAVRLTIAPTPNGDVSPER